MLHFLESRRQKVIGEKYMLNDPAECMKTLNAWEEGGGNIIINNSAV